MKWITAVVSDRRKKRKNQDSGVVAILTPESEYERLIIEALIKIIPEVSITDLGGKCKELRCIGSPNSLKLFLDF